MANKKQNQVGKLTSSQALDNATHDDELDLRMVELAGSPNPPGSPTRPVYGVRVNADGSMSSRAPDGDVGAYNCNKMADPYFLFSNAVGDWMVKNVGSSVIGYATIKNNPTVETYAEAEANPAGLTYGRYDEAF